MIVDLHNHTTLCNHAKGELEEYVESAINIGTKYFGFSDHAPMNFDKKYRMNFEQMSEYQKKIKELKKKYQDKIEILLGYEVDYIDGLVDSRVLNAKVDYLIGSVHFIDKWGFDNPEFIDEYKNKDIDTIYKDYFEQIEQLAKSGHFQIVGHLDLIKVMGYRSQKDVKKIALNAIKEIKKSQMVVEISSAGLRKPAKEIYPSSSLMELLCEYDIPITFASDAHHPKQVGFKSDELEEYAKSFGYSKCAIFRDKEIDMINF